MFKAPTIILGIYILSSCSSLKNPEAGNYSSDADRQARLDSLSAISMDSVSNSQQFITPQKNSPTNRRD